MEALSKKNGMDTSRRGFLKLTSLAAAAGALSLTASGQSRRITPAIDSNLQDKAFWKTVQDQFILDPKSVYMNIRTTGSMPRRVFDNYERYNRLVARRPMGSMTDLGVDLGMTKQREKLGE
jgi:hypothetical protein